MREKFINYPISCVLVLVIWVVCMVPVPETPLSDVPLMDKWTHFIMYGTLTLSIWIEYIRKHEKNSGKAAFTNHLAIGGVVCPIIMGGLVELAQAYLTTCRSGDPLDFLANSIGVLLGCAIGAVVMKLRQ